MLRTSPLSPVNLRATAALLTGAALFSLAALPGRGGAPTVPETPIHPQLRYYEPAERTERETLETDLCVYGGTSAGVAAAVWAARLGRKVVLVAPEPHLGGLTTGGLTYTDFGNKNSIGGLSREFYRRVGRKYGVDEEWKFEPKVAEAVFEEMIAEARVPVRRRHFLKGVKRRDGRLTELTTERGLTVRARMFIDATYEGDLMARAGVSFTVGREDNAKYKETLNGIQVRDKHQFQAPVSPYVVEGDPKSGLLPGINPHPLPPQGTGDHRVQAYNFRMTLTRVPENRIPFPRPQGYDRRQYELLARYLKTGWNEVFQKFDAIRGNKTDTNNHGAVSTDFIGQNYDWPTAGYRKRNEIFRRHVVYQQGLMWFLANDPAVPEKIRTEMAGWGLCRDEFQDTGGWPRQLYIREARRMVSDYVLTEHNCRGTILAEDSVGMGAYGMDSHNCQRFVRDGRVLNEGDVQVGGFKPYPISYRSIVPRRGECANLLVPVCLSSSHIAYGSARMEPVFMILGHSAATAVDLALKGNLAVQEVPYAQLRERLLAEEQVLEWKGGSASPINPRQLPGIVLDDTSAARTGHWVESSRSQERRVGTGYIHDDNRRDGMARLIYRPRIPSAGSYEVILVAPPNSNRADNARVILRIPGREPVTLRVNMRTGSGFLSLGRHTLPEGDGTTVEVDNQDATGFVVADGLQLLPSPG